MTNDNDTLRPEYPEDLIKSGVRGKYAKQYHEGTNVVLIDPDLLPEAALEPLPEGEFYWREILGLRCLTLAGEELGTVEEIWPTGDVDVLVVRQADRTRLIPALAGLMVRVDREAGELWIDPPEGLLEDA